MKRAFTLIAVIAALVYWAGCKKCYQCQDTCVKCVLTDSGQVLLTQVICSDSFSSLPAFHSAVSADSAMGYVCSATASAYNKNFCANEPGSQDYLNYYNEGGTATCTSK